MSDFKKLHVWRKAHALAINSHRVAGTIRGGSLISLRSQIVRAAMSIPANIVEGRSQKSEKNFSRFLNYSLNSAKELEYHLLVARDIEAIRRSDYISLLAQVIDVRKMLHGLIASISDKPPNEPPKKPVPE